MALRRATVRIVDGVPTISALVAPSVPRRLPRWRFRPTPWLSALSTTASNTFGVLKLTLRASGHGRQLVPQTGKTYTDSGTTTCR
jgi:hypothetical protein